MTTVHVNNSTKKDKDIESFSPVTPEQQIQRLEELTSPYIGSQELSQEVRTQIVLENQKNSWSIVQHREVTRTGLVVFLTKTFAISSAASFIIFASAIVMPNPKVDADQLTKFLAAVTTSQAALLTLVVRYYFKTNTKEK
ncbi:hypothetical protein H6F89_14325 [Cyanobacteria bacterium FACHB-63]|nr:hypothetical protein [Cyanobacteria bacterium FACHB-63]